VATSFGRRAVDWELKGVPIRVLVGPRDLAEGRIGLVRRDTGEERTVPVADAATEVAKLIDEVQRDLLATATKRRDDRTRDVDTVEDAVEAAKTGFARLPWALLADGGEARLAEDGISVRCLLRPDGSLPASEDEPDIVATVARSY
ncbi:MAG TPA: His/Gly/Thr/Pro-type tRNA ligase C-terminal domain-containing protein, partial [Acidimicrobiales bacterium]|nr:His/Gly/Thr/Pro-type tRNA ligase C-terminal domain-containing protein [Acidimicrobiales bacterium]